jgi:hypothetical protein
VLVVGTPRSGTTWIGQALGRCHDTVYVHEPDGLNDAYALRAKRGRALQIELAPGEPAAEYETLWRCAFDGGAPDRSMRGRAAKRLVDTSRLTDRLAALRGEPASRRVRLAMALATPSRPQASRHVVVKSVHACLAAEWIAHRFEPAVVVVRRHPLNVLASWKTLGHGGDPRLAAQLADVARRRWGLRLPVDDAGRSARRAIAYGVLMGALSDAAGRHRDWAVVRHDDVCIEPHARIAEVASSVGLEFSAEAAAFLRQSDQPGEGYQTRRLAGAAADKWRRVLTEAEADEALTILSRFPTELELAS